MNEVNDTRFWFITGCSRGLRRALVAQAAEGPR
jgi:hypothetical protein